MKNKKTKHGDLDSPYLHKSLTFMESLDVSPSHLEVAKLKTPVSKKSTNQFNCIVTMPSPVRKQAAEPIINNYLSENISRKPQASLRSQSVVQTYE